MKQVGAYKPAKATDTSCFAYDGGRCSATKAAACAGCPFYKSRQDARNNAQMQAFEERRRSQYNETRTIRTRT